MFQITLNRRLLCTVYVKLCKFEKWCKFLSHIKAKTCKKKLHKLRPACIPKLELHRQFPIFVKVSSDKMSKLYSCYWYIQLSIVLWGIGAMVHNKSIRINFVISEPLVSLMIQFFPKILIHNHLIKWGDYSEWLSYVAFPEFYSLSGTKCVNCLSHLLSPIEILIKIQLDATVCRHLFTAKSLYMFRVSQHPSSGVLKTVTTASGTGHNTGTATSLQCSQCGHVGGK